MNFELNDTQRQLQDSLNRVLAEHGSFLVRQESAASDLGFNEKLWLAFADLGLLALPVPETHNGLGGGTRDLLPVLEAMGRALVLEPYFASAVLGARALSRAGTDEQCVRVLPRVADGTLRLAFAHNETEGRHLPLWVETNARKVDGVWLLNGEKSLVLNAQHAQKIIVSARVKGMPADAEGLALFLVDQDSPGLELRAMRLSDDTAAAALTLRDLVAEPLGDKERIGEERVAAEVIEDVLAAGTAALCATALGAMQAAFDLTVSYLNTREQFGQPIGNNQVLRHCAAEMLISLELVRSAAIMAAIAVDNGHSEQSTLDLIRSKFLVSRHGRRLCQNAVQLHGGIGMTEEYAVGHYLRKIVVIDQLLGDEYAQTKALAAALARQETAGKANVERRKAASPV